MERIVDNDKLICIVYRDSDWSRGLNFITPDELFIQVGSWWYPEGKNLQRHIHNKVPRMADRTMEMVYVRRGSMNLELTDDNGAYLQTIFLGEGDLGVLVSGGHGYTILEDDTQIIEAKNGPFIGVDEDKSII